MCFVIIIEQLFGFLLFEGYDSIALTLDCKLGSFYHKLFLLAIDRYSPYASISF